MKYLITMARGSEIRTFTYASLAEGEKAATENGWTIQAVQPVRRG